MLGRGVEKPADLAAARKMLALGAQHDDSDAPFGVERLEGRAQLLSLGHRDDVERRPVEDDIGALARRIDLDPEPVEPVDAGGRTRRKRGYGRGRIGFARRGIGDRRVGLRYASSGVGHGFAPVFWAGAPFRFPRFGRRGGLRTGIHPSARYSYAASRGPAALSSSSTRGGVSGNSRSATPIASATALAMHTGVLIEFPSATPFARAASPAT